jgi:hypothetical protein
MQTETAAGMMADRDVPPWRLHVLRAAYAIFVVPALVMAPFLDGPLAKLVVHGPTERGMINGIHVGLFVMCALGLRYPLRMLPILLFEFTWKAIWLLAYGLPQWRTGVGSPQLNLDLILIGLGPVLFGLAIPWTYVWRYYVLAPGERWRSSNDGKIVAETTG